MKLYYTLGENSPIVEELFKTISTCYPISNSGDTKLLAKLEAGSLLNYEIKTEDSICQIVAGSKTALCRAIGVVLSGVTHEVANSDFKTFGILFDASRNFVFNKEYLKKYLTAAALLGCNMAMIYTKDTYKLPNEPYFGYLRGAYTIEELKDLDDFADKLGVELVGCIQALGHLEPVLRWPHYGKISDTPACLLTTEPDSYTLIEKMMAFYSECFRSRRIHLGMDETHDLGRGRYIDLNGYRRGFDIYNDHLNKSVVMCEKFGYKPIIWSDMYFRMGSKSMDYYDLEAVTPPEVIAEIPAEVQLAYWDYFHTDKDFYMDWIERHKKLGSIPIMTSGIWTWRTLWYDHGTTRDTVTPCVEACQESGVEEIIFSMWGDDGGFCDWGSSLAGLAFSSTLMYPQSKASAEALFATIGNGADYKLHIKLGEMGEQEGDLALYAPGVLWEDPLLQIYWKEQQAIMGEEYWGKIERNLKELKSLIPTEIADNSIVGSLAHAKLILTVLYNKVKLIAHLREAYINGAEGFANWNYSSDIQELIRNFVELEESYRKQWYTNGKSAGFEVMQIRLAGQRQRWQECERRINEFITNGTEIVEILESAGGGGIVHQYKFLATGSVYL